MSKIKFKKNFYLILNDVFIISFLALFIFTLLEISFPRLVSNYININIILGICLLTAILTLFLEPVINLPTKTDSKIMYWFNWFLTFLMAGIGSGVVYWYALRLGVMAVILAIVTALGIFLSIISFKK